MFELRLDGGSTDPDELVNFDDMNQIHDFDDLSNLFGGQMYLDVDAQEIVDYETYGTTPSDEATIKPIKSARWAFASDSEGWRGYIQQEMNDLEISGIQGLLEGGIGSGYTDLMWTNKCYEVMAAHLRDIESVISEIAEEIGFDFWAIFADGVDFQKLTWCAFEESVRRIIEREVEIIL